MLTLSGNRYPIVEERVIGLGFHFGLSPVDLFYGNRGGKSPLVITSYTPTLLTNKEGISPGSHLKETDLYPIDCIWGMLHVWQVYAGADESLRSC